MTNKELPATKKRSRWECEPDIVDEEKESARSHKMPHPSLATADCSLETSTKTITILGDRNKEFVINIEALLNSGSPALAALVSDNWREGKQGSIDWSGMDSNIIGLILSYLNHKTYALRTTNTFDTVNSELVDWEVAIPDLQRNPIYYHVQMFIFADLYLLRDFQDQVVKQVTGELVQSNTSIKYITKTARFVYEKNDLFINQETGLHVAIAEGVFARIIRSSCGKNAFSTLMNDYPQLAINMIPSMKTLAKEKRDLASAYFFGSESYHCPCRDKFKD